MMKFVSAANPPFGFSCRQEKAKILTLAMNAFRAIVLSATETTTKMNYQNLGTHA